jgi:hypothetical protein
MIRFLPRKEDIIFLSEKDQGLFCLRTIKISKASFSVTRSEFCCRLLRKESNSRCMDGSLELNLGSVVIDPMSAVELS